jgi:hypothetical protein
VKIFLAICLGIAVASSAYADNQGDALRKRVTDFCTAEFKGDDAAQADFILDSLKEKYIVDFRDEPVDVVKSFHIVSIAVNGDSAKVVVEYDVIAQFRNVAYSGYPNLKKSQAIPFKRADEFIPAHLPQFRQSTTWKFDHSDGQWYLISRRIPKVSKDGLIEVLKKDVALDSEIIKMDPTPHTPSEYVRAWNEKKIKTLEELEPNGK